jgi:alanine transaminase
VIEFCYARRLVILADEVYQENVYYPDTAPFHSFNKVLASCPAHIAKSVELISYHSASKGIVGEVGLAMLDFTI